MAAVQRLPEAVWRSFVLTDQSGTERRRRSFVSLARFTVKRRLRVLANSGTCNCEGTNAECDAGASNALFRDSGSGAVTKSYRTFLKCYLTTGQRRGREMSLNNKYVLAIEGILLGAVVFGKVG